MSYISEMFKRANLEQIQTFLFLGVEKVNPNNYTTYEKRHEKALSAAMDAIERNFDDERKAEKVSNVVAESIGKIEDIYMEVGMRCGAMLAMQLLTPPQE